MPPAKIVVLALIIFTEASGFNPSLSIKSCTRQAVTVTLIGGENGGIIYVQGQGPGCKQETSSNVTTHKFLLSQCNIKWGETFRLVVQRKALYQTGEDKQIPVTCSVDLGDLDVTNKIGIGAKGDEAEQMMLVKPSAMMRLLKNGRSVEGTPVRLGDVITMELKLHSEYANDFDISVKSCTASNIPIITDHCAVDPDLFPPFARISRGFLSSAFGAFRTTDFLGGVVTMTFTCTLEVCVGSCDVIPCPDGHNGWGRKKRYSSASGSYGGNTTKAPPGNKRKWTESKTVIDPTHQHDDAYAAIKHGGLRRENNMTLDLKGADENVTVVDDVYVQSILTIAPDEDMQAVKEKKNEICMNYGVSVTLIVFMAVSLAGFGVTLWILIRRSTYKERQYKEQRHFSRQYYCEDEEF